MNASPTDLIKERVTIVDVVGQYVKLTKAGKNYRGLSPFNKEKTPSFYVSPDRGVYYCFSSGKGGDIFSFIQEMEGLDFRGSLKMLAERAGVELVQESKEARDERERQYMLIEEAANWFEAQLKQKPEAVEYLKKRGVEEKTIHEWRLGYAPSGWTNARDYLVGKGFTDYELDKAGLAKRGEKGGFYDRFRGRIMFPISDSAGRVVAFSGRIFEAEEGKDAAKYLNSPETAQYDKSRILYGYHAAKQVIRKYDFSVLVEGQMDLVMAHQGGFPNTVAVSGTGLTEFHLELLDRLSKNVLMAFDADAAGIRSAGRGAKLALAKGMEVKVARLPDGVDPADMIRDDVDGWKKAVRDSKHIIDFYLDIFDEANGDVRKFAQAVRSEILPFVATIQSPIDRAHFIGRIAKRIGVPENAVADEVGQYVATGANETQSQEEILAPKQNSRVNISRKALLTRQLIGLLWLTRESKERHVDPASVTTQLGTILGIDALERIEKFFEPERAKLIFETEVVLTESDEDTTFSLKEYVEELLVDLKREIAKEETKQVEQAMQRAEAEGDDKKVQELLARSVELARIVQGQ